MKLFSHTLSRKNINVQAAIFAQLIALCLHCFFIVIFYIHDITPLYYYNYFSIFIFLLSIYLALTKPGYILYATLVIAFEVFIHQILAVYLLGWDYGFQYLFIAVAAYFVIGNYTKFNLPLILTTIGFICFIVTYLLKIYTVPKYSMPYATREFLYLLNTISTFFIASATPLIFSLSAKRYQAALLYESNTDALTKLTNRKRAMELIKKEFSRYNRNKSEFVLSIGDIDNFKKINDTYGHDIGDTVLVKIADIMKKELRQHDIKARWGGEEFFFMFPDTNITNGLLVLNNLRKKISDMKICAGQNQLMVTMTFGVVSSQYSNDPETCIKLADNALYEGKKNGKNQVIQSVHEPR